MKAFHDISQEILTIMILETQIKDKIKEKNLTKETKVKKEKIMFKNLDHIVEIIRIQKE